MKLSKSFFYTLREDVKDEESKSGNFLVRSSMITKIGSGIYSFLPLGLKVNKKIQNIIREEMNKSGAEELLMPSLLPEEYFVASGRKDKFGPSMFTLNDRYSREYALGPTHEELFTTIAKQKIRSYKDMPYNLYQMANKFRDEARPRYGLIRVREFTMKDAYSFDTNEETCNISYEKMRETYNKIFDRLGLNYRVVKADTGAMGGSLSEEFQAITDIGEDIIVLCDSCDYASNIEVSECITNEIVSSEKAISRELIHTPNVKTIEDLKNNYNIEYDKMVKTLIYKVDDKFVACLVKSDCDVNETKLRILFDATDVSLAETEDVENITNASVGFAGPIDLTIPVVADLDIKNMRNFLVGANKTDYHFKNVNLEDFKILKFADIKNVKEGDICPKCGGKIYFKKGIEVGNIFKLGTKYSDSLNLKYADENNELKSVVMGCYGIGVGRIISAIAEQNMTEKGINWPINIAPYEVAIIPINFEDELIKNKSLELYDNLVNIGVDVALDDRNERPGVKFNDMELIGIPIQIIIGRGITNNEVELKFNNEKYNINYEDAINKVQEIIDNNWK